MADVVLTKQKIEDGKTSRLKEWADEIREREDEAIETLKNERMHSESTVIEHTDEFQTIGEEDSSLPGQ